MENTRKNHIAAADATIATLPLCYIAPLATASDAPLSKYLQVHALPSAQPLASGAQVRYVSPEEDTSHDPRAAEGYAQLVPASETR